MQNDGWEWKHIKLWTDDLGSWNTKPQDDLLS